jgi:hypothetical protein
MRAFEFGSLAGQTSTLVVTVDNGGTSAINQSFLNTQIVGLATNITGNVGGLFYSGEAVVLTTDASGLANLNFASSASDLFAIADDGLDRIQLRNRPFDYQVWDRDGSGVSVDDTRGYFDTGSGSSPWPVTGSVVGEVPVRAPAPATLALLGLGLLGLRLRGRA